MMYLIFHSIDAVIDKYLLCLNIQILKFTIMKSFFYNGTHDKRLKNLSYKTIREVISIYNTLFRYRLQERPVLLEQIHSEQLDLFQYSLPFLLMQVILQ